MNDVVMQMLKTGMDLPSFKEQIEVFKKLVEAQKEQEQACEQNLDDLMASLKKIEEVIKDANQTEDISDDKFREIFPDIMQYLKLRMEMNEDDEHDDECCDHDHHDDCCDNEDLYDYSYEPEDFPALEEIDLKEFKLDLEDFKNMVNEGFFDSEEDTEEELKGKDEILKLIEKLENTFAAVNSIEELDSEAIDAIRPEYDLYNQISALFLDMLQDDADFGEEEFADDDLVCIECDDLSPMHND